MRLKIRGTRSISGECEVDLSRGKMRKKILDPKSTSGVEEQSLSSGMREMRKKEKEKERRKIRDLKRISDEEAEVDLSREKRGRGRGLVRKSISVVEVEESLSSDKMMEGRKTRVQRSTLGQGEEESLSRVRDGMR